MTLTLSVPKVQEDTIMVEVPSFWKNRANSSHINEYIAILDENTFCKVMMWDDFVNIINGTINLGDTYLRCIGTKNSSTDYQPVSEEEFLSIYSEAIEAASLTPRLKTFNDDLAALGLKRKEV